MKSNILAFGITKEIFGAGSFSIELAEGCSVNELKITLEEKFPQLKQLSSFRIAVNREFAVDGQMISPQDEVAVIPPVSGG